MRSRLHIITALAIVAAAGSCAPRTHRTPDDTLVMVIETAMTTADPRYATTVYDRKLSYFVAPGLVSVDSDTLEPRLELAEKVDRIDPRTWDVTLRAGLKFADGSPVTAADVAGTYSFLLAPKSPSMYSKGFTERFSKVEATGPLTVRFHLHEPLATFMTDIDFGIVSHAHGTPKSGKTVGAGPYRLVEITSLHAVLERNPYYYGPPPKVGRIQIKFVKDASARLLMIVGGSADLIQNAVRLDLVDEVLERPRVSVQWGPSVFLTYMLLNNADPLLADVRVRQAIALAIDRPAIVAAKFGGHAILATGLLPPNHWAYETNVARYDHDLARARELLDAAGRRDPDGPGPLPRFSLTYKTSSDAFRVGVAKVLAAQLAEVGIAVEVRPFEFGTFFADVKKGTYQIATMQTSEIAEPDYHFTYFHSSWIPSAKNPDGYNRWRYVNPEVDRLTYAGRHELDLAKRKQIYSQVQKIVADEVPIIPLWHEDNLVLSNADVKGYRMTPNARLVGLREVYKVAN